MRFDYLLGKIRDAGFTTEPFRHIEIANFFTASDFAEITGCDEILIPPQSSDSDLFDALFERSYKVIDFPGCITDKDVYVKWHRTKAVDHRANTSCEGFGITVRLTQPRSSVMRELYAFLGSSTFQQTLADKFGVQMPDVFYDFGIQKYLDGYEISPHPDIRRKALTYMVNINPGTGSESREHHTHYMRFRPERKYVQSYWEGRTDEDRCWVPWDWCETVTQQRANNSIVIFSPNNESLHAVRAQYDHLQGQRTQLYGNLWYHQVPVKPGPEWEDYRIERTAPALVPTVSLSDRLKSLVPADLKRVVKRAIGRDQATTNVITDRLRK